MQLTHMDLKTLFSILHQQQEEIVALSQEALKLQSQLTALQPAVSPKRAEPVAANGQES